MNKIDLKFKELREKNEKALIPFIALGDKSLDETVEIAQVLEKAGADIVELGIPFSDPLADGPIIQDAYHRALTSGINIKDMIKTVENITSKINIPVIIMVYYNVVYCKGVEKFLNDLENIIIVVRVRQEGLGPVGIILQIFPLDHHAQVLVVQNNAFDGQTLHMNGCQLLNIHEHGTVPVNIHDQSVRISQARSHGGGKSIAHGSQTAGSGQTAGLVKFEELSGKHLMLAHPRADDGVLVRRLAVELFNDSLRGDIPLAVLIGEGVLFFPAVNHAEPFRSAGVAGGFALPAFCGQSGVEYPEGVLHVCADGIRHLLVFIDLAGVNVNVNDRGFRTEHIDGACHAVVKPGAQGNNQIRFIHGVIRKHGSVHAQPTQGKRVGFRHGANAHQGGRHRNLGTFRKFQKIPGSFRRNDAAAGVNDRPPGVFTYQRMATTCI